METQRWRLWSLLYLAFYAAAAVAAVALPLHLLEHVPWEQLRQPMRPWVLYSLLVAAGVHGGIGVHRVARDYARGRTARLLGDLAAALVAAATIGVGVAGLLSLYRP